MYNDPGQPTQPPYGQGQSPYGQLQPPYAPPYGVPPAFAQAAKKRRVWPWVILGIVVVVALAGGGIFALARLITHNPATDVVNQYYTAIEHQDYATAFGYLDTTAIMGKSSGTQQITQNLFIQVCQTVDIAEGNVSTYNISSIPPNSNNGVNTEDFTVSVTRNGKSYDVHLQLKQEGNDWKIVSLDNI